MKAQTPPHVGVIDALAAGLRLAGRRPWLMLIPVAVDTLLWMMPRLSIEVLLQRLLIAWEALLTAVYSPAQLAAMGELLSLARDAAAQLGEQTNIALTLTAGWLAPTSALAPAQVNRWLLISDGVLAPLGLALQLPGVQALRGADAAIAISSHISFLLVVVGLWLIAQLLAAFYLRWAALSLNGATLEQEDRSTRSMPPIHIAQTPFGRLFLRLLGLNLLLGAALLFLRLPLATVIALMGVSGGSGTAFLFVLSGGVTLWLTMSLLVALFFASDAIMVDGQGLLMGIWRSLILTRGSGLRTLAFIVLVNLLMLGARAVWGLIGQAPLGAAIAILGNAYLVTGMVLAAIVYYDGLRREWQAAVADKAGK